jgi:hypothetical protein
LQGFEEGGSVEVRGERFERREVRATAFPTRGREGAKEGKSACPCRWRSTKLCCPNPIY